MKLEAVVHPTSISQHDPAFDPDIHIAVEVLSSPAFAAKMIGVPVTAYHHDTMRAVDIMYARKEPLTAANMRRALIELHQTQPTAMELAKAQLGKNNPAVTQHSLSAIWQKVPEVIQNARGPGVFGSVTAFWRQGDRWLVAIDLDSSRMGEFQKRLVKQGGALGEVSLTHAVIDGTIEPLELSFTIQGLRTGSAINRIVAASHNTAARMSDQTIAPAVEQPTSNMDTDVPGMGTGPETDTLRQLYNTLTEEQRTQFLKELNNIKCLSVKHSAASEARLNELEKAMSHVQEATANALNELGPSCFGNVRQRSAEEWGRSPASLATANEFILAAAANNLQKRKRDDEELTHALKDITGDAPKVIAASRAKKEEAPAEEEFFRELRNMRKALSDLP